VFYVWGYFHLARRKINFTFTVDGVAMTKKTTILTGFLGAGKTTYLNHMLKSNPNTKFAIIENEFGEQSIDGDLIIRSSDSIVEMNNGCLCCSLNENLYDLLNDLYHRKNEFDELIIEATGIADPAGIAEPFLLHSAVKKTFALSHTICLIDAEQIRAQLNNTEEARMQIAFSDVLLINKTDLVSNPDIDELQVILKGINPNATIVIKEKEVFPCIPDNISALKEDAANRRQHSPDCNHHKSCDHHHDTHKGHVHTHQHTDIVTHSFVFNQPFDLKMLHHQLFVFLTFQAKDMYRVKGIIFTNDSTKKIVVQSVGKRVSIEETGEWKEEEVRISKMVFIGKNIQPQGLKKLLEKCISIPIA
jgi:G3E family GTPase